jgi:hypothetical protein
MKKTLSEQYDKLVNKYVKKFEKKHDTYLEFWVSDISGDIACFGDNFFNYDDIR